MVEKETKASPAPPRAAAHPRHMMLISEHPAQWRRVVRAFLREGLSRGESCLCLNCLYSRPSVCRFLDAVGMNADAAQRQGLLTFFSAEEMFNRQEIFSPVTCMAALIKVGRNALPNRTRPVRVVVDMNWAADSRLNHQRLLLYEDMLNHRLLPNYPANVLCHYDRALFPPAFLNQVLALHQGQVAIPGPVGAGSGLPLPLDKGNRHQPRLAAL
ncbi:MAG: MEDS domain-containing protein [Deltaproteobacteria bacterium]|nr:MEDS domain-containing protein [Deltaproteobacteria bacterium]